MKNSLSLTLFLFLSFLWSCAQEKGFTLQLAEKKAASGEQVCVEVYARQFTDILSTQYSIAWDDKVLRFARVADFGLPGLGEQNFGRPPDRPDRLTMAWFEPNLQSVSVPDQKVLYSVCFDVIGPAGAVSAVSITGDPTIIEVANAAEQVIELNSTPGKVSVN